MNKAMIDICTLKFVSNFFSYGKQSLRPSVSTDGFYFKQLRGKYFM